MMLRIIVGSILLFYSGLGFSTNVNDYPCQSDEKNDLLLCPNWDEIDFSDNIDLDFSLNTCIREWLINPSFQLTQETYEMLKNFINRN